MSTSRRTFDVDIDVSGNVKRESYGTRAMVYNAETERVLAHPSGVYLEKVPVDTLTGNAAFSYEHGETAGVFKVDVLTNTSYNHFKTKAEVLKAIEQEPDWDLFKRRDIVSKLPHLGNNVDVVLELQPKSIEDLADVLALIRPGKMHLLDEYKKDKSSARRYLYSRPKTGIYFKRSHAISYAVMIAATVNHLYDIGISW